METFVTMQEGKTALHVLVETQRPDLEDILDLLVSQQANINVMSDLEGSTALHLTVRHQRSPDVECLTAKLISLGADIHSRDYVSAAKSASER